MSIFLRPSGAYEVLGLRTQGFASLHPGLLSYRRFAADLERRYCAGYDFIHDRKEISGLASGAGAFSSFGPERTPARTRKR